MDKYNALYFKVQQAARAAERDRQRKEAEMEAETRWMCNMVTQSSERRLAQRMKAKRMKAQREAAEKKNEAFAKKITAALFGCVIALAASFVLMFLGYYLAALVSSGVSSLLLLLSAAAIEIRLNSTTKGR